MASLETHRNAVYATDSVAATSSDIPAQEPLMDASQATLVHESRISAKVEMPKQVDRKRRRTEVNQDDSAEPVRTPAERVSVVHSA
jgi:hypothetical protein